MYIKKILLFIGILGVVLGSIFSFILYRRIFADNTSFETPSVEVLIPNEASFYTVIHTISPYLKNVKSFIWLAEKKEYNKYIKPGKYVIVNGLGNNDIINVLRSENKPVKVKFNNQERLENLAGRIAKQIEADSTSLIHAFKDPAFLKDSEFNEQTAIAMYMPNTYHFYWNTTAEEFRDRMYKQYKTF